MEILNDNNKKCIRPRTVWLGLPSHALLFIGARKGKEYDTGIHVCVFYQVGRLG